MLRQVIADLKTSSSARLLFLYELPFRGVGFEISDGLIKDDLELFIDALQVNLEIGSSGLKEICITLEGIGRDGRLASGRKKR